MKRVPVLVVGLFVLVGMSAPAALGVSRKPPKHLDPTLNAVLTARIAATLGPTAQHNTTNTLPPGPGVVVPFEIAPVAKNKTGSVRAVLYDYLFQPSSNVSLQAQISIVEHVSASTAISSVRAEVQANNTDSRNTRFTGVARLGDLAFSKEALSTPCPTPSPQSTGPLTAVCSFSPPRQVFVQGKYSVGITDYGPPPHSTDLFNPLEMTIANVLAGK